MTNRILFITNTPETCGVNAFGKSLYSRLSLINNFITIYAPCNTWDDAKKMIIDFQPNIVLYNFHSYTLPWVTENNLNEFLHIKHVAIVHEASMITPPQIIKRLLPDNLPRIISDCQNEYVESTIPIIGSFGFASWHKGFHNLILKIQEQFDDAIFRLHMPPSFYCDPAADMSKQIAVECQNRIKKPGISLQVDYTFLSEQELIRWLNKNTLNAFHYEPLPYDPGISSVLDYAISARRPIGITKSPMFRHINNISSSIYLEDTPMKEIIQNGLAPILPFFTKWSKDNFIKYWKDIICSL
jgi:hypothetical protein